MLEIRFGASLGPRPGRDAEILNHCEAWIGDKPVGLVAKTRRPAATVNYHHDGAEPDPPTEVPETILYEWKSPAPFGPNGLTHLSAPTAAGLMEALSRLDEALDV